MNFKKLILWTNFDDRFIMLTDFDNYVGIDYEFKCYSDYLNEGNVI